ncbi:MAG: M23 family metallopeptidase [Solirubrobacterales bacterium]
MVALTASDAASTVQPPRATAIACLERCAASHKAAVGGKIAITGRRLRQVDEVDFPAMTGLVSATPNTVRAHRLVVVVPPHARTGQPRIVASSGHRYPATESLGVVPARRLPPPGSFDVLGAKVKPRRAFFDRGRGVALSFRFRARGAVDVRVKLVHGQQVRRRWTLRRESPYQRHRLRWDGALSHGRAAKRGRYRFRLQRTGHRAHPSPAFNLYDGVFPVRGRHGYGGPVQRFGAPRSGGRVHQGQDVFASCGTRVVAARGGRVQARGWDPVLYGNWVVIDGRGTKTDYRYAHFRHPASVHDGERVRTGQRIGRVGKTGNARTVGCQLHFEVWPRGWERRNPVDPLPMLKRWDRWS